MSDRYCEFCTIYDGELRLCNEAGQCPRDPSHLTSSLEGIVREIERRRKDAVRKAMGWIEVQNRLDDLLEKLSAPKETSP